MVNRVGSDGQVIIDERIREALGVEPGALAFQTLVDDHVEIRFRSPSARDSLLGVLRPLVRHWPGDPDVTDDAWTAQEWRGSGRL